MTTAQRIGNCYEAAVIYMWENSLGSWLDNPNRDLLLVQAEVAGQGKLEGKTLGHAWIEDGDTVIDNTHGRGIRMPKFLYYAIGQIYELNNFHVYTPKDVRDKIVLHGHYGPWDLRGKHPTFAKAPFQATKKRRKG